jgi:hypothetical protein
VKDPKLIPTYSGSPNTFSDEVIRNGGYEEVKGGSPNASATGLVEPNDEDGDDAPPSEGKEVATPLAPSSVHEDKDELTEDVDNSDTDGDVDDNEEAADDDKSAGRLIKVNINYYLYNCVRPNINSLLYRRFLIPHR